MYQQSDEEQMAPMQIFDKRDAIKISLNATAEKNATEISNNSEQICQFNPHLDPYGKAEPEQALVSVDQSVEFRNYFVKHKHRDERVKIFDVLRELLIERGYTQISMISDREEQQIMVVRVVEKVEGSLMTVIVEDQFTKDKLQIKEGIMWLGMICAVKAKWSQGRYKLQKIIDLSRPIPQIRAHLSANTTTNRIMMIKGPFRPKFSNQDSGIRILTNQISKLRRQNIHINQLIVMGPILAKNNKDVQNFTLERTYEQEYEVIVATLCSEVAKISSNIKIYIMPSLEDIVSMYPIPQPAYIPEQKAQKVKYLSNPSSLKMETRGSTCTLDFMNYDILKSLQSHKAGRVPNNKELRQQILQTYIKHPFYLTNTATAQDPFDQVNLCNLFNNGNFGDVVVFSSNTSPPFVNDIGGRIVVNVGALGVDYHYTGKNFIVLMSLYGGTGPVGQRLKVETISHG